MARRAALALLLCGCGWSGAGVAGRGALEVANRAGYARARLESTVLESYLAVHPGLRVIQRHLSSDPAEYRRRLLDAMLAGRPPDAVLLDLSDVRVFADRGMLLDLAPYLSRVGVTLGDYDSTVLSGFRRGRAVYALPTGSSPLVVAYNKDLFDRAGLSVPADDWTWDDFLGLAKRLTLDRDGDGTIDQWGTNVDSRVTFWLAWVWAGWPRCPVRWGRRATVSTPRPIAALRWYVVTQPHRSHSRGRRHGHSWGKVAMLTVGIPVPSCGPGVGATALASARCRIAQTPPATLCAAGYAVPSLRCRGSSRWAGRLPHGFAHRSPAW